MTHYEVLGVSPAAEVAEIRAAYVSAARRWHPDRHVGASIAEQRTARMQMQAVNEAWRVLRDTSARRAYDRTLGGSGPSSGRVADDDTDRFEERERWDDDEWEWAARASTAPPRAALVAPVALLFGAMAAFGSWLLFGFPFLLPLSIVAGVLSVVLFVAAPMLAMFAAKNHR